MQLRRLRLLPLLLLALALSACYEPGYYLQAVRGHLQLIDQRRPIAELLADPATPEALKTRLRLVATLRDFASHELALPENDSFSAYTAIDRPAAVWNVVATPEFSLTPRTWCFPVAGCVPYRGYFARTDADAFAATLRAAGDDTSVYAVPAYSTLGWFDDPVLSSFIDWPEIALAALLFHELAHQQLYLPGDAPFAEAFATVVEEEGVRRWLLRSGAEAQARYDVQRQRRREFKALVQQTRGELLRLYASGRPANEMRTAKAELFALLQTRYAAQRAAWGGYAGYDRWFAEELNNARFAATDTYEALLPALRALLRRERDDLLAFYQTAAQLAALEPAAREEQLERLAAGATPE
jgi:predicted aminopeptidase